MYYYYGWAVCNAVCNDVAMLWQGCDNAVCKVVGCGKVVARLWQGCGKVVARLWQGCGNSVAML